MIDLISEIWATMRTNKVRTFLTGFSVSWGIFMLIMLVGAAKGVYNAAQYGSEASSSNRLQIWPGRASRPYKGLKEGRRIELKENNIADLTKDIPDKVDEVFAVANGSTSQVSTSLNSINNGYIGVYPGYLPRLEIKYGRILNTRDLEEMRKVVMLCEKDAKTLFREPSEAVGKIVNIGDIAFTVIGVYDHDWETSVYVPYTVAKAMGGYSDRVDQLIVSTKNITTAEEAEKFENDVRESLGRANSFEATDRSAVWIWNRFLNMLEMQGAFGILNAVMWIIGIFSLVTGIIGVSNIMFVSVRERTHEIGIRRAIGAKPASILGHVIAESVGLTALFGYIGILLGTIGTEILAHSFEGSEFMRDPTLNLSIAIEVTVLLVIAGSLAGLFPALRALKIKPVEALRDE